MEFVSLDDCGAVIALALLEPIKTIARLKMPGQNFASHALSMHNCI